MTLVKILTIFNGWKPKKCTGRQSFPIHQKGFGSETIYYHISTYKSQLLYLYNLHRSLEYNVHRILSPGFQFLFNLQPIRSSSLRTFSLKKKTEGTRLAPLWKKLHQGAAIKRQKAGVLLSAVLPLLRWGALPGATVMTPKM